MTQKSKKPAATEGKKAGKVNSASTDKEARALFNSGVKAECPAGNGLYLSVNGVKAASWIMRFQMNKKRQRIGLGPYPAISLAEARQLVAENKQLIAQGLNPLEARQALRRKALAEAITFDQVAADYIEAKRSEWRREKQANDWTSSLATYASPIIGHMAPKDITTEHVLEVLLPIWEAQYETAIKIRTRISKVLDAAKARKLRTGDNPADWRGNLDVRLPKLDKKKKHQPALPYPQIGELWQELQSNSSVSAKTLQFTILTCVRAGESRGAHWNEIDLKAKLWTIPADRMKAGKEHKVPLSQAVIDVLQSLPRAPSGLIFESTKPGAPIGDMAMTMLLRRLDKAKFEQDRKGYRDPDGRPVVTHGFRSTFRDWCAEETNTANIVAEMALAHTVGSDVERAYRRGDLLERRRALMNQWADFVCAEVKE